MRHFAWVAAGLILLAAFLLGNQEVSPADELVAKAVRFLEALNQGDFARAAKDFDETMMKVSPPGKLEEFWKGVPGHLGNFKRRTAARREELGSYDIVLITCEFEKVTLDARIVFNKNKEIAGFQFVPSLPPAHYQEPAYADPALFEEQEITVGSKGWPLPGILTLPKGNGPFPGLVLVHGSGPNDRDESIGPNKPFKDIAWGLATKGIAVLRYDKRTKVYGPKFVDPGLAKSLTVNEESIDDALAAVEFLQNVKKIDPRKIFVLGHSLGGMLIPRIALRGEHLGLAGFIVMAGLTRPIEDTYVRQMAYVLGLDGALSEDDKKQLEDLKAQEAEIKALQDQDALSGKKLLGAYPKYWLDLRGYYPPDVAKSMAQPLLVLQGSRDYQVTTDDFENWEKALGSKPNAEFKLYPKLNHLFIEGRGLPLPAEYLQKAGSVAQPVIDDMASFIIRK
jgi:dienelactone hydrolase